MSVAGADERHSMTSGRGDGNGCDVIVRPRDLGGAWDRVRASDWMIDAVFTAVIVRDF